MRPSCPIPALLAGLPTLSQAAIVPAADTSLVGSMIQVVLALALVLCLIVAAAWLMRRFSLAPRSGNGQMRVVSGVMVGQRERVVIVEVGEQWLVLGVTAQNVNLLSHLPKPENATSENVTPPPFADWLARALQKRISNKPETPGQA